MKFKVHYKERFYLACMVLISLFAYGALIITLSASLAIPEVFKIYLKIIPAIIALIFISSMIFVGNLKGNAIKVNSRQFPEIYKILETQAKALNFKQLPEVYVLQNGGVLNAFALKFAHRDYVVILSSVLEIAYQEGLDAVAFIIGHELGHIKRKHTSFFKSVFLLPAKLVPFLGNAYSRACEYTCDNIGYSLSPKGALDGTLILAAGKTLYKQVDANELVLSLQLESSFLRSFAEIFATHPAMLKRVAAMYKLKRQDLTPETPAFNTPRVDLKQFEAQP